jgi:molecular chaperone DnaK
MAADNMSLGRFRLEGIPPAPRGAPQVEVTFDIDANGILHVAARDKATGKQQQVTITASTNLSKEEIERKVAEARQHEAEDRRQRELIEARNTADALVYQTEKALAELGDKVPAAERQKIEAHITALKEAAASSDTARLRQLVEELQNTFHALSQQLYAQGGTSAPEGYGTGDSDNGSDRHTGSPEEDEGVIEGEFRSV